MGTVIARGFTDWDDIAVRSSKAQPIPGVARGELPALAGRPLRPPTSALGWYDDNFHFCLPGQPEVDTGLTGLTGPFDWIGRGGSPVPPVTRVCTFDGVCTDLTGPAPVARGGSPSYPTPVFPRRPPRRRGVPAIPIARPAPYQPHQFAWMGRGMGAYEATIFWTPLAPADPNVVNAAVLAPEAACPASPEAENLSGLGCPSNRYGVSGLGALPFGLDSQSLFWIAVLGGAAFVLPMLLKSKKAKSRALRKARYKYAAETAAIQARYA